MRTWHFTLVLDRTLQRSDLTAFDQHGETLGDPENGSLTPTSGGDSPSVLYCSTPGIALLDAASRAAHAIYQHTGARAVRIEVDEENRQSLEGLAGVA
ncbi:hypothetical protein [Streptomyces noursei]